MPMDLLRFATAGSVDDGKSTLIGRLLYDSKSLFSDQLDAVERVSRDRGNDYTDLALLTDGLRAEREQGITIDVAYRYFATPRRKFIIADTPGHIQYTRNMVTGASTADVALILLDARKGITEQSRRHAFLATLLGVPHVVVCVNKMDLVDFDETVFEAIRDEFSEFATRLRVRDMTFIPISALLGDNVVTRSERMPWYDGSPLLSPPRAAARRERPQLRGRPLPGPVRRPAAELRGPRLPRLRRHGRVGRAQARRPGRGAAERPRVDDRVDRHRRRAGRRGLPADGGHDHAHRRDRHLARRHALPAAQHADGRPRTSTPRSAGWTRARRSWSGASTRSSTRPAGRGRWSGSSTTGSTSTRCTATRTATELSLNEIGRVQLRVDPAAVRGPLPAEPRRPARSSSSTRPATRRSPPA